MRRQVCWEERLDEGVKREVRVSFEGKNQIRWQFKRSDGPEWDYAVPPAREDWERLVAAMEGRYRRSLAPYRDVQTARRLANEAFPGLVCGG